MGSLEKRFAETLLSLAENVEQADMVDSALNVLGRLYIKNEEFRGLMLDPVISNQNRSETLLDILEMLGYIKNGSDTSDNGIRTRKNRGKSKPHIVDAEESDSMDIEATAAVADAGILLLRFLQLLLDKGRLAFLPDIAEEYHGIKTKYRKSIRIIARSPAPLNSKTLSKLREKYKKQYGAANAEIENKIEPSALGGFIVQIGDIRIDDTLYGRLAALTRTVTAGAVRQTAGAGYFDFQEKVS